MRNLLIKLLSRQQLYVVIYISLTEDLCIQVSFSSLIVCQLLCVGVGRANIVNSCVSQYQKLMDLQNVGQGYVG